MNAQRAISATVFGLGILGSVAGCAVYPRVLFVVGANDCTQEILAMTLALATPLPVCILALWRRVIAGTWLIFAGVFFVYGTLVQRSYMIHERHFNNQSGVFQTFLGSLAVGAPLIAFGCFAVATDLAGWPSIWKSTNAEEKRGQSS